MHEGTHMTGYAPNSEDIIYQCSAPTLMFASSSRCSIPSCLLALQGHLGEEVEVQLHEGTHVTGHALTSEDAITDTIPA